MGQRLMGYTLPAETASVDSVVHMGPDESVLILLKHCRDMKQQETRLRLITLLLLLSCMGLFVVITGADLGHRGSSTSRGGESAVQPSPAFSKQETNCPSDPVNTPTRLHIHLKSVAPDKEYDEQYMKWRVTFGEKYDDERRAIVIPHGGFYFVYLRFTLRCPSEDGEESLKLFSVELHNWKKGYGNTILTEAMDDVACTSERSRTVFVGGLFDFWEGDDIRVWVREGYNLITKSSFGAYLT